MVAADDHHEVGLAGDDASPQFPDPGTNAAGVSGQIVGPQRADLAVADDAGIRLDLDDRGIEHRNRFATGPLVTAFVERQIDPEGTNSLDLHGPLTSLTGGW